MSLAPAEALLARLIARPAGVDRDAAETPQQAAAAHELMRRGHPLLVQDGSWRLACAASHFDPARFAAAQHGTLGAHFEIWETSASTNDLARAGAERGAPHGTLWLAEAQTRGRGRQGRQWSCAPHAGLLVSWLLRDPFAAAVPPTLLPLALGLGACEGLRTATGLDVRPKWPNDLLLQERKLAGLLVEARPGAQASAIAGFGMNIGRDAIDAQLPQATTLAAAGCALRREILLAAILAGVERRLEDCRRGAAPQLLAAWLELDLTQGRRVQVHAGGEAFAARVVGVTAAGLLRLETDAGARHELGAGEVHLQ